MRINFLLIIAIFFLGQTLSAQQKNDFGFNLDSRLYSNMLGGATEQAVLKEGVYHEQKIGLTYDYRTRGGFVLKSGLNLRVTNDRLIEKNNLELKNLYLSFSVKDNFFANLGNYYTNFSQYTLGRNLEGLFGRINFGKTSIFPVYGQIIRAENNKRYQRLVYGARMQTNFNSGQAGLSYINVADNPDSVSNSAGILLREENTVIGADGQINIGRLTVEGEMASSGYNEKKTSLSATDQAYRLKSRYSAGELKGRLEYEMVGSSFATLSGWAVPDRQVLKGGLSYDVSQWLGAEISYETYHNNLRGYLPRTETVEIPQIAFNLIPSKWLDAFASYKIRSSFSNDNPRMIKRQLTTTSFGTNFRFGNWRPMVNLELNNYRDDLNSASDYQNIFADFGLKLSMESADSLWKIYPSLGYRLNTDKFSATSKKDTTSTLNGRLAANYDKYWEFGGNLLSVGSNRQSPVLRSGRLSYEAEVSYKFSGQDNKKLSIKYSVNDYHQETTTTVDSSEKVLETRLYLKI